MTVDSDREWTFPATTERVWDALADVSSYPQWWPWLRRFEAVGLVEGDVWLCTVQPPLPYSLTFTITIDSVETGRRIDATLNGDLRGTAHLELGELESGSGLRLVSSLTPARRPIAILTRLAGPVARWGHDWVLDTGARQFRTHGLRGR